VRDDQQADAVLNGLAAPKRRVHPECGDGWKCLYQPLIDLCDLYGIEILQIKEKFGTLNFYVGITEGKTDIRVLVRAAENASAHVCEVCGEYGQDGYDDVSKRIKWKANTGGVGWIRTLCKPCREQHDKR
jgi:hypothetical protein